MQSLLLKRKVPMVLMASQDLFSQQHSTLLVLRWSKQCNTSPLASYTKLQMLTSLPSFLKPNPPAPLMTIGQLAFSTFYTKSSPKFWHIGYLRSYPPLFPPTRLHLSKEDPSTNTLPWPMNFSKNSTPRLEEVLCACSWTSQRLLIILTSFSSSNLLPFWASLRNGLA